MSRCAEAFVVNILYISQYFPPEVCAPAVRVRDFSREWVRAGHAVRVLTGFPNHPDGTLDPRYRLRWLQGFSRETRECVEVCRTWLVPAANRGFWGRAANYASFAMSASIAGPLVAPRHGVVIATSPQLLVGAAGYLTARSRGLPFVFEVRDLWPQSIEAVGAMANRSRLYRNLDRLARFLYARADRIVVDGEAKRSQLIALGVPPQKTAVIPNGVPPDFGFEPDSPAAASARCRIRKQWGLDRRFVAAYVGTLGMAHGLETVLLAADRLRHVPDVVFLLIGEGAEGARLRSKSAELRMENVRFRGKVQHDDVAACLAAADVCLVPLRKKEVFKTAIPSKMFEAMAAARPVILGVEGEARDILAAADAGIAVPPEDPIALAAAILRLQSDATLARRLGAAGRRAVTRKFSRRVQAATYLELLHELDCRRTTQVQAQTVSVGRYRASALSQFSGGKKS